MFTGIEVFGRGFTQVTPLEFFPYIEHRIAVVYGRNGSGKSTVSEAFSSFSQRSSEGQEKGAGSDLNVQLLPRGGGDDDPVIEAFVFNEKFIEENVKVESAGIRTIVLIGEAGKIKNDLDDAENVRTGLQAEMNYVQSELDLAQVRVMNAEKQVVSGLKEGWAERYRLIKGNRIRAQVSEREVVEFAAMSKLEEPVEALRQEFEEGLRSYLQIREASEITDSVPVFSAEGLVKGLNVELLERALRPASGSQLIALVATTLEDHEALVHQGRSLFDDPEIARCPLCLQQIAGDYRQRLAEAIADAIGEESDVFQSELSKARLSPLKISVPGELVELDTRLAQHISSQAAQVDQAIASWNTALEEKSSLLYKAMDFDVRPLAKAATELARLLGELAKLKADWNSGVQKAQVTERRLLTLSKELARAEIHPSLETLAACSAEAEMVSNKLNAVQAELRENWQLVSALRAKLENVDVAASAINEGVAMVCADSSRLTLVPDVDAPGEGQFLLQSRGRNIRPSTLSVGERNILALSYFFTLLQSAVEQGADPNRMLIVLDDPVSSLDVDNKIGIISLLESRLRRFLRKHEGSRLLVLTHDVQVFQDLGKLAKAIAGTLTSNKGDGRVAAWELCISGVSTAIERKLRRVPSGFDEPLREYKTLLNFVYEFAAARPEEVVDASIQTLTVGNALRRVLEAFGTFIYYQQSITSNEILEAYNDVKNKPVADPIRQALVTVLHGGSHFQGRFLALGDFTPGTTVGQHTQQEVAQLVLALMYEVQPHHMRQYLPKSALQKLKSWTTLLE